MDITSRKTQIYSICWCASGSGKQVRCLLQEDNRYPSLYNYHVFVILCFCWLALIFLYSTGSNSKNGILQKHWPSSLLDDVLACAEKVVCHSLYTNYFLSLTILKFKAHYSELNWNISSPPLTTSKSKVSGLKKLIRQVQSNSEDNSKADIGRSTADPLKPWRVKFWGYIKTIKAALPARMSTIQWWGVSSFDWIKWQSLMVIVI